MKRHLSKKTQHVVIIGSGFGGLNAAKTLANQPGFSITIIDKTNHHLFQPLLYQVATAALSPGDIAAPIREIFRSNKNIKTLMATVLSINKEEKVVTLDDNQHISYDYLIVAPGSRHSYFGQNQWEKFAPGLKTLKDALRVREMILTSFELAENATDISLIESLLTFIVIGAGPTGIEMAGAIAEIAHQSLQSNFRSIDPSKTKVYLIEGGNQVLNSYPQKLAIYAQHTLEKQGVTVLLNTRVTEITDEGVAFGDQFIPAHNIIWAAGNEASPLLKTLDVPCDKSGRVIVQPDLSLPMNPEVFVLGDAAFLKENDQPLPAIAPVALQQGKFVGNLIRKQIPINNRPAFHYKDRGMMANIGRFNALVLSGPLQSSGFFAWLAWCFVHIYFLIGFRTKILVFIDWVFYFFKGQRNVRLIVRPAKVRKKEKNS
ncbi:NAD(P)/FAD-dependent oxidoreductase [Legionella saoudiensis]|uniref:NAD(P)/FAD-dependent oxidoreductase n=1 Tax=Legionella saoudiensis TaxID=1750561 RepID=UPI000731ACE2|nr:NAD(P)/FAD-dependent oxidoreductase [Legionella saoudiensis]